MTRTDSNRKRPARFRIEVICGTTPKAAAALYHQLATETPFAARQPNGTAVKERSKEHE